MTDSTYSSADLANLEIIDRVARAAHLWIRHGKSTRRFSTADKLPADRQNLVAGLISGLCDLLNLDSRCAVYSAYAYALLDSEKEQALAIACLILNPQIEKKYQSVFQEGQKAASDLIAILRWPEVDSPQLVEHSQAVHH